MTKDEVGFAIDLAAKEGWNPGIHDGECFYAIDMSGFFVGELDGELVGCLSAVSYNESSGFMGMFIVKPQFRNKGIGTQIWSEGLAYLGKRNIGLNSVMRMQEYYLRKGFRPAYRLLRYEGVGKGDMPDGVVDISHVSFEELIEYDTATFSFRRPQFLRCWINQREGVTMAVVKSSRLVGYGVIRRCQTGYKIGPLFADDEHTAENLFLALKSHVPGNPIFLDTPQPNAAAIALAEQHDMSVVAQAVRMYTKEEPSVPLRRVYGVTSLELG